MDVSLENIFMKNKTPLVKRTSFVLLKKKNSKINLALILKLPDGCHLLKSPIETSGIMWCSFFIAETMEQFT